MKKFLSVLLALVMVLSLSTVAFAAENEATFDTVVDDPETDEVTENETSFDVKTKANVDLGENYADIVYSIKVEWTVDTADIDISEGALYVWDTESLKYVKDEQNTTAFALGENNSVDVTITFTNRSNADVTYTVAYADNDTDELTTEEALAAESAAKNGKLANADTAEGVSTAAEMGTGHDYTIDGEKIDQQGAEDVVIYKGTVTVTKIADGADFTNTNLTLGTYTVTLGEYVAEVTVADLAATIAEEDMPDTQEDSWSSADGGLCCILSGNVMLQKVMTGYWLEDYALADTVVTPAGNNYICTSMYGATITFVMTNGKLTAITVSNEPTAITVGQDTVDMTPLNGTYTKQTT